MNWTLKIKKIIKTILKLIFIYSINYCLNEIIFSCTFQSHSVHISWLVIKPENGWTLLEKEGALAWQGMVHNEVQGLIESPSAPESPMIFESISEDLAIIIPGLIDNIDADTFVMDWAYETTWLFKFLLASFGILVFSSGKVMSLQDTLLILTGSPEPFISVITKGAFGRASDKQPFCNNKNRIWIWILLIKN